MEDSLPRVPVPDLGASAAQFLEWCAPLLSAGQLAATESAVAEFLAAGSPARTGHARIVSGESSPGAHSWLDSFWRDRYLGRRVRVAVNANFFFLLHDRPGNQYQRAAGLIMSALDHKLAVDAERYPVTIQRKRALSMVQHKYLFSSTRIPGHQRDRARTPYSADWPGPSPERHVVVLSNGHLFQLDVIGPGGVPHTLDELSSALEQIAGTTAGRGQSVGQLTSLDRSEWADVRERLLESHPGNRATMDLIERALIGICLESSSPEGLEATCNELLAGDSGNRWFDKAISFVVFPSGRAGLQGEHCMIDGTTITELIDSITGTGDHQHQQSAGARPQGPPAWRRLDFVLDERLRTDIQRAGESFDRFAAQTAGRLLELPDITVELPKQLGMSPDAFVQIAFQLTHWRAKGALGATYESVSMRHYHHGRTEAMRVLTPELVRFIEAMADPAGDTAERETLARAAAAAHVGRAKQCQAGNAPEQLIWELQLEERRRGVDSGLSLYQSPGWLIMRDDCLSTSSSPTSNVVIFGFGATSGQGIGISYQLLRDRFTLYLSTPASAAGGMGRFADELPGAIKDLAALLRAGHGQPPADSSKRGDAR